MKLILVDDHKLVREGLRGLLRGEPDIEIVGEAEDGRTAVRLVEELHPDVVVMDIDMPDMNGVEATRRITSNGNGAKVIALTASASPQAAARMLDAGASGYVIKTVAFSEFTLALGALRHGKVYLSPSLADSMIGKAGPVEPVVLTAREREVLQLLAEGKATKQVAAHLNVSVKTVETHRAHIMDKLGLDSVAELTKYAIREGITSLGG